MLRWIRLLIFFDQVFLQKRIIMNVGEKKTKLISHDVCLRTRNKLNQCCSARVLQIHRYLILYYQVLNSIPNDFLCISKYFLSQQQGQGESSHIVNVYLLHDFNAGEGWEKLVFIFFFHQYLLIFCVDDEAIELTLMILFLLHYFLNFFLQLSSYLVVFRNLNGKLQFFFIFWTRNFLNFGKFPCQIFPQALCILTTSMNQYYVHWLHLSDELCCLNTVSMSCETNVLH